MENKKVVHFIPQTHWDREWYFTIDDAALLSTYNFERIVEVLENNENFPSFNLDGQTSIIEDCLKLKPALKERISKLVKEKRIFIGPWYTQTDSFFVDGESFIRNLYFGSKFAKELGHSMKIGYLPDTFGHNIQTPQLFKGFGIDNVIFWRGYNPEKINDSYFNWKSLDGTEVLGINFRYGYGNAGGMKMDEKLWEDKFIPMINGASESTKHSHLIMAAGGDQSMIIEELPEMVSSLNDYIGDDYEVKMSDWETLVDSLMKEIKDLSALQEYSGEMRDPYRVRVHRTIGSSRFDIKQKSFELEHKLINILEPLSIIVKECVDKKLINNEVYETAWKLLLDGHAHDSMGACNTDPTNKNILNRFNRAENLIDGTINIFEKVIGKNILEKHNKELVLYNLDTKKVSEQWKEISIFSKTKNVVIIDGEKELPTSVISVKEITGGREIVQTPKGDVEVDLPPFYVLKVIVKVSLESFGYKSFKIKEILDEYETEIEGNSISNDYLSVSVNEDVFVVIDKRNNREYKNIISIENVANDGDSYDFSPISDDFPITNWTLSNVKTSKYENEISKLTFTAEVEIPYELIDRDNRSSEFVKQIFEFEVIQIDDKLNFNIKTINVAKDHRFRIRFCHDSRNNFIKTDVPFGYIRRSYQSIPINWKENMVEKPVNYFPIINTFASIDIDSSLIINTKGLKEIEITDENNIFLTLYKSDGYLGKNDLEWRPNRASGINDILVPTPDAQHLYKEMEFEFQLVIKNNSEISEKELNELKGLYIDKFDYYQSQSLATFNGRLERFEIQINEYDLKEEVSLFDMDNLTLVSSYISHKDNSNIFRFVNYNNEEFSADDIVSIFGGEYVNFAEEKLENEKINKYKLLTIRK